MSVAIALSQGLLAGIPDSASWGRPQGYRCAGCYHGTEVFLRHAACRRVGGAFGGKVARSMPVAAAAAVAAAKTGRRVRYSLNRNDDMRINGGAPVTWWLLCADLEHLSAFSSLLVY